MEESKRIDKWLWEVRVFKTRSQATLACRSGKLKIEDQIVKPSRELHQGDLVTYHQPPITRTYRVLDFPKSRVGAKLAADFMEELTPEEEYQKLKLIKEMNFEYRDHGIGRPTKRHRRDIDLLKKRWKE
ncbi:MAG: RNA-binding S4 domain-containing protein [Bacteroidales bacterium]|nr:RNA-binding S4 domain-containing protein [Deltaproteobacteria bacterium]MBL7138032.1 RNA-binding S4 domain-containing protein [Bacteroidales bacterium]